MIDYAIFFAGSGSFGEAAYRLGRNCLLVDNNPQAIDVMKKRFNNFNCIFLDDNNNEIITSTHSSDSLQGELL